MIPYWLYPSFWKYVFKKNTGIRNIICRIRGHPYGVVWYNVSGLEPDMSCNNCGEDLG